MKKQYYPDIWASIHLIVLYTFTQVVVEFPLALYDYNNSTSLMSSQLIRLPLFSITTLFILFYGYKKSGFKVQELFPLKRFPILSILPLIGVLWAIQFFLTDINFFVIKHLPPPNWFYQFFEPLFNSAPGEISGAVRVIVIAPIVEEFIFRGVLMKGFIKNYRPAIAIFLAAALFAAFHLNPWQMPAAFLLGIVSGIVRVRTGSLLYSIFVHATHNSLVYLSVKYYEELKPYIEVERDQENYLIYTALAVVSLTLLFITTRGKVTTRGEG